MIKIFVIAGGLSEKCLPLGISKTLMFYHSLKEKVAPKEPKDGSLHLKPNPLAV